jgi:HEAT repeat protein
MRFTLRDVFWLLLVVALGLGWWTERTRLRRQLDVADARLKVFETQLEITYKVDGMVWPHGPLGAGVSFHDRQPPLSVAEFLDLLKSDDEAGLFESSLVRNQGEPLRDDLLPPLLELLDSDKQVWQERAVLTLGYLKSKPDVVVPKLIPFLATTDPNRLELQSNALAAIGKYGPLAHEAIPAVRQLMNDNSSPFAATAAWQLRQIDPAAAADIEERLVELLNHPHRNNRQTAARIIARDPTIHIDRAVAALTQRLEIEEDEGCRKQLVEAINQAKVKAKTSARFGSD